MNEENYSDLKQLINSLDLLQTEIFQSGLCSPQSYLEEIPALIKNSKQIGLKFAAEKLESIQKKLELKQHNLEFNYDQVCDDYFKLNAYLKIIESNILTLDY